ncbi:unnamed protein product, partial [Discosporangium mesarthrocarpum]
THPPIHPFIHPSVQGHTHFTYARIHIKSSRPFTHLIRPSGSSTPSVHPSICAGAFLGYLRHTLTSNKLGIRGGGGLFSSAAAPDEEEIVFKV